MSRSKRQIASGTDVARHLGDEAESAREGRVATALRQRAIYLEGFPGAVVASVLPNAPNGWIRADGQGVTTDFPDLRADLISAGSPYGTDGSGNPRVPNLNGDEFPRGHATPGGTGGAASHAHGVVVTGVTGVQTFPGGTASPALQPGTGSLHDHPFTGAGATDAQSNLPPFANVVFFVKT